MEFLADYGLFLAKTITITLAVLIVFSMIVTLRSRLKHKELGEIEVHKVNDRFDEIEDSLQKSLLDKEAYKSLNKEKKKAEKSKAKEKKKANKKSKKHAEKEKSEQADEDKKRLFVLTFDGDIHASEVEFLREEITAVLTIAREKDEILLIIESAGGLVHDYGLAASQLQRIRDRKIPLTAAVDRVAASGGYLMACVADRIIAAPFAILGSIGVLAQVPNFHRLMKKHDIDFEQITAGEYKRTLTLFGKNTNKARDKFQRDIEDTHLLFKEFVSEHRPVVDIEQVSTGEHWFGKRALDKKLVDELISSDDYLLKQRESADIYEVTYTRKQTLSERMTTCIRLLIRQWVPTYKGVSSIR